MFNIIPFILLIGSIALIIIIFVKKLPELTAMNVGTIAKDKEQQVKKKILDERFKRQTEKITKAVGGIFAKVGKSMSVKVQEAREQLEKQHEEMASQRLNVDLSEGDADIKEAVIEEKLEEAVEMTDDEDFSQAEKSFIEVITADPKNVEAYIGLGDLYTRQRMYTEAKESLEYALKLDPAQIMAYLDLTDIAESQGNLEEAYEYISLAKSLEGRNPKILDKHIELSVKVGNKPAGRNSLEILKEVNPENAKIERFEDGLR